MIMGIKKRIIIIEPILNIKVFILEKSYVKKRTRLDKKTRKKIL